MSGLPKRGPGRPKGSVNKVTGDIRNMIETALSNAGGVAYLERQAIANPKAFLALIGRIIPQQTVVSGDKTLPGIRIEFVKAPEES